ISADAPLAANSTSSSGRKNEGAETVLSTPSLLQTPPMRRSLFSRCGRRLNRYSGRSFLRQRHLAHIQRHERREQGEGGAHKEGIVPGARHLEQIGGKASS